MPKKSFDVPDIGHVAVYRHKRAKSLRITIQPTGNIRVTVPFWLPYKAGIQFALSRKAWIEMNRRTPSLIINNQLVGKSHRIIFNPTETLKTSSRVKDLAITITHPYTLASTSQAVQASARKSAIKALKQQAELLLPQRLKSLSLKYDLPYKSVSIRNLRSRWGSCSQETDITLSLFLMNLPWELIDYVLLHELVHTKIHNHGPKFWDFMQSCNLESQELRKILKSYNPTI